MIQRSTPPLASDLIDWQSKGQRISVDGFGNQIFLLDVGQADAAPDKTLVVLHGYPESSHSYVDALPFLRQRFDRVILWDHMGFGFSDKPSSNFSYSVFSQAAIAIKVLQYCKVSGAHFLAHDFGDTVLTELVFLLHSCCPSWFHHGIESVTFTNGGMVLEEYKYRYTQKLLPTAMGKWMSRYGNFRFIFEQQVKSAHGNNLLPPSKIDAMYALLNDKAFPELLHHLNLYQYERQKFEQSRWLAVLREMDVPMHISWGMDDRVNPVAIAYYLKDRVQPKAKLVTVAGLGHFGEVQDAQLWWNQGVGRFF